MYVCTYRLPGASGSAEGLSDEGLSAEGLSDEGLAEDLLSCQASSTALQPEQLCQYSLFERCTRLSEI